MDARKSKKNSRPRADAKRPEQRRRAKKAAGGKSSPDRRRESAKRNGAPAPGRESPDRRVPKSADVPAKAPRKPRRTSVPLTRRPRNREELREWLRKHLGLRIPDRCVCSNHQSPWDFFSDLIFNRPPLMLVHGGRGCGKSFLTALETHLTSLWFPRLGTRILGGSLAQSAQVYRAIREIADEHAKRLRAIKANEEETPSPWMSDFRTNARSEDSRDSGEEVDNPTPDDPATGDALIRRAKVGGYLPAQSEVDSPRPLPKGAKRDVSRSKLVAFRDNEARYANGSDVSILAASNTSVRGPHVASLKLDEVDEIDADIRDAAIGMCMSLKNVPGSILLTSTWHRVDGPMAKLIDQFRRDSLPVYTLCVFEVLETCPESRSGKDLENCPTCPLKKYCHDVPAGEPPKAKRSNGYYSIDSLIQKMRLVSARVFEADYLCLAPRAEGNWFTEFNEGVHVNDLRAEYDSRYPVHISIDPGLRCGAVFFQIVPVRTITGTEDEIHVFADYYEESQSHERDAAAILRVSERFSHGRRDVVSIDLSCGHRDGNGIRTVGEFERSGLKGIAFWPAASRIEGLSLIESFLSPAAGESRLYIHSRCQRLREAFRFYRRAKRKGQWTDAPEDPQHPHEETIDSLKGGLLVAYPEGRKPQPSLSRVSAKQVF